MKLVELEGKWLNIDQICVVRQEPDTASEFKTEIVVGDGLVKLKMTTDEAIHKIKSVV